MEETVRDAWNWLGQEFVEFGLRWAIVAVFALGFGGWFGKRYRQMRRDMEAMNADMAAMKAEPQVLNVVMSGSQPDDIAEAIRKELATPETEQAMRLQEAIKDLPLQPLGNGHRYADLPAGTRAVVMKDGSVRLALPILIKESFGAGTREGGEIKLVLEHKKVDAEANWRASPGAGQLAAKLIAQAPSLEKVREIWDTFYASPSRTDLNWASWAYELRLKELGAMRTK